ncbi:MAG: putative helicase, ATP-dependent [Ramlibacter sp.]|nr:putative helicase, ATP-dependent [Ramlibacter sp.]
MARINVTTDSVRELVRSKLAPIYLAVGNIAGVAKLLNTTNAVARAGMVLHANRLHTVLSDDVAQSVNDRTVDLIDLAAAEVLAADETLFERAADETRRLQAKANDLQQFANAGVEDIASRLDVPRAIVRSVLDTSRATANDHHRETKPVNLLAKRPDWSFQDLAVSRCMEAFQRRPAGRIGLVLPTGAGKTRTALRVILATFRTADPDASVIWVTHRLSLRDQAHRELQKLLAQESEDAGDLNRLANRIKFMMLQDARQLLKEPIQRLAMVVIDEAHHAAAPTYVGLLDSIPSTPVLMLTATPNRTDQLPIGIDEIAYTITFRELAERGAILIPQFEDFPVDDFAWKPGQVDRLAARVIAEAEDRFTKTLVIAPRIERIHEFYAALIKALPDDHPLEAEDVGFIHSEGNSLNIPNGQFLEVFATKPRGIVVSAQLLLEGFDDPAINAVVITYPSSSLVVLMQAAGRSVRYAPGKAAAYVLQARNDSLEYHFDQRWLYQEISDLLRPQLIDIEYDNQSELQLKFAELLDRHNLDASAKQRMLEKVSAQQSGELCNLLLYGLPFFGPVSEFERSAKWGAVLETPGESARVRAVFNGFCEMGANVSDPSDFLLTQTSHHGFKRDLTASSVWRQLTGLLIASFFAKQEVYGGSAEAAPGNRPARNNGATTWLKYVTFRFRPSTPLPVTLFLEDCHNKKELESSYLQSAELWRAMVKTPLPLGGFEGFLLRLETYETLVRLLEDARITLAACEPGQQVGTLANLLSSTAEPLPNRLLIRIESLLSPLRATEQLLDLQKLKF